MDKPILKNHLPELLKEYREEHPDLMQNDIARLIGIDPSTFSRYINGRTENINIDIWEKLARFFGVAGHEVFDVE